MNRYEVTTKYSTPLGGRSIETKIEGKGTLSQVVAAHQKVVKFVDDELIGRGETK